MQAINASIQTETANDIAKKMTQRMTAHACTASALTQKGNKYGIKNKNEKTNKKGKPIADVAKLAAVESQKARAHDKLVPFRLPVSNLLIATASIGIIPNCAIPNSHAPPYIIINGLPTLAEQTAGNSKSPVIKLKAK